MIDYVFAQMEISIENGLKHEDRLQALKLFLPKLARVSINSKRR